MIKNYLLTIFVLVLTIGMAHSQQTSLKGSVQKTNGQAVTYAHVQLKNTQKEAVTDRKGEFEIKRVEPGTYTLLISLEGYLLDSLEIEVKAGEQKTLPAIVINENNRQLDEVKVKGEQNGKYVETEPSLSLRLNTPLIEVPQNISVATQQSMKDFGINGTTDLARLTSGITKRYGGAHEYAFTIRGTDATNNVFRNGIGSYWWNQQSDAFMLDRVEFVKGPAGFMIGNSEPGGLLNEVTKQADGEKVREVELAYGSFQLMRAGFDVGGKFSKTSKFSYRLVFGGQYTQANYDFYKAQRTYLVSSLRYSYKEGSHIQLEYNRTNGYSAADSYTNLSFDGKKALLPLDFNIADPGAMHGITTSDNYIRLSHSHRFKKGWSLKTQFADIIGHYAGDGMYISYFTPNADTLYREYYYSTYASRLQAAQTFLDGRFKTGTKIEHAVLTGFDYGNSTVKSEYSEFDPFNWGAHLPIVVNDPAYDLSPEDLADTFSFPKEDWNMQWIAWYGQDHIKFYNKLILTLAGRFSYVETWASRDDAKVYDNKFAPRLGLTYLLTKNMSLYALYDETFLPQTGRKIDNSLPKPLTGNNMEIGYKALLMQERFMINASLFHTKKNNVLVQNPLTTFSEERGQVTSKGFEVGFVGKLGKNIMVNINYTYTDARITQDLDSAVVGFRTFSTTPHVANAMIRYRFETGKLKGFSLGAGTQYMDKMAAAWVGYTDPAEKEMAAPAYITFDMNIAYEYKKYTFRLNVYNLANTRYMSNALWNSSYDPAVPGYFSYTPNAPVNFRIAANYRF